MASSDGKFITFDFFPFCDDFVELNYPLICADEIIRKRLLIDGEGAGDDRKIQTLLRTFLKWCNNTDGTEGEK